MLSACAVVALVTTGCGGGSGKTTATDLQPTSSTSSSTTATAAPTGSPTSGPAVEPTTVEPGQPTGADDAVPSQEASGTGGGASSGQTQEDGGQSTSSGPVLTKPGTYTYDTRGSAKSALGNRDLSGTSTLAVDAPSGARQHSTQKGPNGTQEQTLEKHSDGLYLVDLKMSGQGFDEEFKPAKPVLFLAWPPAQDKAWSWRATSTDGKYTINVDSAITKTGQTVSVGGDAVMTIVLHSTIHVTGDNVDMTIQQDDWVDTSRSLVVKEHATSSGTAFNTQFTSDVTRTLESLQPK